MGHLLRSNVPKPSQQYFFFLLGFSFFFLCTLGTQKIFLNPVIPEPLVPRRPGKSVNSSKQFNYWRERRIRFSRCPTGISVFGVVTVMTRRSRGALGIPTDHAAPTPLPTSPRRIRRRMFGYHRTVAFGLVEWEHRLRVFYSFFFKPPRRSLTREGTIAF